MTKLKIRDRDSVFLLPPDTSILKIELGKSTMVVRRIESAEKLNASYLSVLEIGTVSIFAKQVVKIIPAREASVLDGGGGGFPPRFERGKDNYFFQIRNGKLNEIKSVKALISMLPEHHDENGTICPHSRNIW